MLGDSLDHFDKRVAMHEHLFELGDGVRLGLVRRGRGIGMTKLLGECRRIPLPRIAESVKAQGKRCHHERQEDQEDLHLQGDTQFENLLEIRSCLQEPTRLARLFPGISSGDTW